MATLTHLVRPTPPVIAGLVPAIQSPTFAAADTLDARDKPGHDGYRDMVGRERPFIATYIMANRRNGTLYTGVSSALIDRVYQHREGVREGFTKRYGCTRLVWFETFPRMVDAIAKERAIKHWPRRWKINLIEEHNPEWRDLWPDLVGC